MALVSAGLPQLTDGYERLTVLRVLCILVPVIDIFRNFMPFRASIEQLLTCIAQDVWRDGIQFQSDVFEHCRTVSTVV